MFKARRRAHIGSDMTAAVLSLLVCNVLANCGNRTVDPLRDAGIADVRGLPPAPDLSPPSARDLAPPSAPDLPPPMPDLVPPVPDLAPPTPDLPPPLPDLTPPIPPDAAPLPPGCQPYVDGFSTSCKSEATWTAYATAACQQKGLPVVVNIMFLAPCGPGLYGKVSAACCPASDGP